MSPRDSIRKALGFLDAAWFKKRQPLVDPPVDSLLSAEQSYLLELMRRDNAVCKPPFRASAHWQHVAKIFEDAFRSEGLESPEDQSYNFRFSGFAAGDFRLHRYVCWLYYRRLKEEDRLGLFRKLRATCKHGRGYAYDFDGDLVSLDLLFSIDDFYSLYELNPLIATEHVTLGELGAGWGRLAYVVCEVNPRCSYVIFDLPEILMISQDYLPRLLPASNIHRYERNRELAEVGREALADAGLWFFGPQHMEKFSTGSLDLVVNIASFQEMPSEYIALYANSFSRIASGGTASSASSNSARVMSIALMRSNHLMRTRFRVIGIAGFLANLDERRVRRGRVSHRSNAIS